MAPEDDPWYLQLRDFGKGLAAGELSLLPISSLKLIFDSR